MQPENRKNIIEQHRFRFVNREYRETTSCYLHLAPDNPVVDETLAMMYGLTG
jgi:hypothetical protein